MSEAENTPLLIQHLPEEPTEDNLLDAFLSAVDAKGLSPYPAQEEAILEIMADNHVILNTPTGSGKSLVAQAMHFKSLAEGKRSYYTSPIKALVSEKFFALCEDFGAENVGMLTGDASINHDAPIICCTAEILSNMALRQGALAPVDMVVMDEFHYYSDSDRGMAWQVPLLRLPQTTFLLMSATMGDNPVINDGIEKLTGKSVRVVRSTDRPVPLDFTFSFKPIHETLHDLVAAGQSPIYVVNFTQRECAEMAQNLMSTNYCSKEEKKEIAAALKGFQFDSPYGKDISKYIRHGVGLHHAGLLPRYRLLVEQLSQQGLLKIICGTDTLGVGVNVPIRTVLFSKLCKFDGEKTGILTVRDFHQISGRAGRKGYDTAGSVVCQAPEHVIENKKIAAKIAANPGKKNKAVKKKPPEKNYAHWDENVFEKLQTSLPEPLTSRFRMSHGLIINVLQGACEHGEDGWQNLQTLINESHERDKDKQTHRDNADIYLDSLKKAELVFVEDEGTDQERLVVDDSLQHDFSLHTASSMYVLDILPTVQSDSEVYALDVLTLVEAILENPRVVLYKQIDKIKGEKIAEMKAEGIPYDERMEQLEQVDYPKPNRDFLYITFNAFAEKHPWVRADNIRPKSIAREMYENFLSFADYIRDYGLQRSEGVLLRYVSQVYKTLVQTIPDEAKDESVLEAQAYFRAMLSQVDSSLVQEWEAMLNPAQTSDVDEVTRPPRLTDDPKACRARIRTEIHQLLKHLSMKDFERAAATVRSTDEHPIDAERFETWMTPYFESYDTLAFNHDARLPVHTRIQEVNRDLWQATQVLLDPEEENFWVIELDIPIEDDFNEQEPVIVVRGIHD